MARSDHSDLEKENLRPIKVGSFWGALSALPILQVFGYILFQAYVFSSQAFNLFSLIFLGWYLIEQTTLFAKINGYIHRKRKTPHQPKPKEMIKILIAILFLFVWFSFIFGKYPFPQLESNLTQIALFYLASWSISGMLATIKRIPHISLTSGVNSETPRGILIAIIIPFIFLSLQSPNELIYMFLMIPLFSIYILLVSWMVEA